MIYWMFTNHTHIDHWDIIPFNAIQSTFPATAWTNIVEIEAENNVIFLCYKALAQHSIGYDIRWYYLFTTIRYGRDKVKTIDNIREQNEKRLIDWLVVWFVFAWVVSLRVYWRLQEIHNSIDCEGHLIFELVWVCFSVWIFFF